ncbi:MAG: acyltransferase [Slackia sp.]|nr:acyltransferase [Slackia sp.]
MAQARIFGYDLVRAIAIFFVVAVHCRVVVDTGTTAGWLWFLACGTLFLTGNALFFMMSGKFNLRERADDAALKKFYRSKARNIIVPILVYFLIRSVYDMRGSLQEVGQVASYYVQGTLSGFAGTEYWFVFTLCGFLLVSPFLARMFARMSDFEVKVFVGIGIGFNAVLTVLDNAGIGFSWSYLFSGFAFTFCLGVLIDRFAGSPHVRRALKWAALACFVLNTAVQHAGYSMYACETSPLYTIMAVGLYLALLDWGEKVPHFRLVSFIAKHSFGVYLCHMMVLYSLQRFFLFDQGLSTIGVHILFALVVFAVSVPLAWLIDSTVVKGAKWLFDAIFGIFDKRKAARIGG